jgi:hypothetical protein
LAQATNAEIWETNLFSFEKFKQIQVAVDDRKME